MSFRFSLTTAFVAITAVASIGVASAAQVTIPVSLVSADGVGQPIGTVTTSDTPAGLELRPALHDLSPGAHGFHLHDKPSCMPGPDADKNGAPSAALGAGGHFDPAKTGRHEGPDGTGHQGDLPALVVAADGTATQTMVAAHLKTSDLAGHSLMIHAGGDNYADQPARLGGGGPRMACGVVP